MSNSAAFLTFTSKQTRVQNARVCHLCTKLQHIKILFQLLSGLRKRVPCAYQALDLVISNSKRFLLDISVTFTRRTVKDTFRFLFCNRKCNGPQLVSLQASTFWQRKWNASQFRSFRLLSSITKDKVGNIEFWVMEIFCIRYSQLMSKTHIITNCGGLPRNKGAGVL